MREDPRKAIVELRGVTKRFPGIVANDNISLTINQGEIFAILGENGAGKSTLMSMLFGLYEPDEGEIFVRGKQAQISSPNDAVELDIGMVHQHFKLIEDYTVTENIILGVEPMKRVLGIFPVVDIKGTHTKIRELSERYGLEVEPTQRIKDMKVYVQQRVEILKMLYREAEILIFDEPTAVLTPQEIHFLLDIIRKLRASGKTIILITHKLEEIKQVADRCAILNRGKLVGVYDVATTTTREMANRMVGRELKTELNHAPFKPQDVILEVDHLYVQDSHQFQAVRDVSLQIRGGEILAIAGVSGNGQSELADAIAGLVKVQEGVIRLRGEDITHAGVRERKSKGLAYIPEDRQTVGLILDETLAANLALKRYDQAPYAQGAFLQKDVIHDYADGLIDQFDIRSSQGADSRVRQMSGGNQQKAIIAREIDLNGDLLIFVQPTRGLDVGAIQAIQERILEERARGKAILLISLELDEIMALADTIAVMYNGQILRTAPREELTADKVGEYMMGVKQ